MLAEMEPYAQRRRYPRVPVRTRCWCETDGITLYARVLNVSEGGVFIHTFAPLSRGVTARVRFALGPTVGAGEVSAEAEVVWIRESSGDASLVPGMGLRFVSIDEASCCLLRALVARQAAVAPG